MWSVHNPFAVLVLVLAVLALLSAVAYPLLRRHRRRIAQWRESPLPAEAAVSATEPGTAGDAGTAEGTLRRRVTPPRLAAVASALITITAVTVALAVGPGGLGRPFASAAVPEDADGPAGTPTTPGEAEPGAAEPSPGAADTPSVEPTVGPDAQDGAADGSGGERSGSAEATPGTTPPADGHAPDGEAPANPADPDSPGAPAGEGEAPVPEGNRPPSSGGATEEPEDPDDVRSRCVNAGLLGIELELCLP